MHVFTDFRMFTPREAVEAVKQLVATIVTPVPDLQYMTRHLLRACYKTEQVAIHAWSLHVVHT